MRIGIVSGSRADRGALEAVRQALQRAGVAHDWFNVPSAMGVTDRRLDVALAASEACWQTAKDLYQNNVDLVLLHGDRYEILGAATAAFLLGLPIVHLGGGDITEGSQDSSIRDAITKLSHLHFATCKTSAERIIRLGEDPQRVHNVGDPGIDIFFNETNHLPPIGQVLRALGIPNGRYFLVAYHPNTLGDTKAELAVLEKALRQALKLMPDVSLVLLDPNKDAGHLLIEKKFKQLGGPRVKYCVNLPRDQYLSLLTHAIALIGNSSAAYYEAPSTGTPVINIGDRQLGRISTEKLGFFAETPRTMLAAMESCYKERPTVSRKNPYGDGKASEKIAQILKKTKPKLLLRKTFY